MSKQDRGGVRTAQDLERKYDLAGMKKAVEMQEEGVNKTNAKLESFINTTLRNAANMQSQTDGEITTWFSNGVPTLDREPTVYWTTDEQKTAHVGDLYYDRDTGNAYEFVLEDGRYKWIIVTDVDTIEALAIANSAYDTEDNKRRVFITQPYPPYENGDLWFCDKEIYICQISKAAINTETGEPEVYEENDFIIATKYTDDTVANKVGDELKVLQGTVLTVVENTNKFEVRIEGAEGTVSALKQTLKGLTITTEDGRTYINGANIYTGTVTAEKIDVTDLFSQNITSTGDFNMGGKGALIYNAEDDTLAIRAAEIMLASGSTVEETISDEIIEASSQILQTAEEITLGILAGYTKASDLETYKKEIENLFKTNEEGFSFEFSQLSERLTEVGNEVSSQKEYIRLVTGCPNCKNPIDPLKDIKCPHCGNEITDVIAMIVIGKSDNLITTVYTNDSLEFRYNGQMVARFTNEVLEVRNISVENQVAFFDKWAIRKGAYIDGVGYNLNDMWIGG